MTVLGVEFYQINFPKNATYTPVRLIYVVSFFIMHFIAGATCAPESLIVWEIR